MRVCARCKQIVPDGETYCGRCGSTQFINQGNPQQNNNNGNMQQRPMPNMQGQQRPMPNMQGQQRPMQNQMQGQMQGQQRPMQNQMQGQQRPMQNQMQGQQRPMQNTQGQMMNQQSMNNMVNQQAPANYNGYTDDDFMDAPVENKKKKLFKSKADKKQEMYAEMQQMQAMKNGEQVNNTVKPMNNINKQVNTGDISVTDWLITLVLLVVPIVNIVFIVKTLKDPSVNVNKKNYLKAYIIYFAAAFVLSLILSMIM